MTYDARGDAKNSTALAMSSGIALRPSGMGDGPRAASPESSRLLTAGVSTLPGATALTRMPWGPYSTASDLVRLTSPAFAAPYAAWLGALAIPLIEVMLTIEPPRSCSNIVRIAARHVRNT